MTVKEAAFERGVTVGAVLQAIADGRVKAEKNGHGWDVDRESLLAYRPRDYRQRRSRVPDPFAGVEGRLGFIFNGMAVNEVSFRKAELRKTEDGRTFQVAPCWKIVARCRNVGHAYRMIWNSPAMPKLTSLNPQTIVGTEQTKYVVSGGYVTTFYTVESITDETTGERIEP